MTIRSKAQKKTIERRDFIKVTAMGGLGLASGISCKTFSRAPYLKNPKLANKVFVIGFDGMDPVLLRRFVARGQMPAFQKLLRGGHSGKLQTTMPPQSPVAWASFITGTNPGGHGIYDFIHRDPTKFLPYLSTSRSYDAERTLDIGKWSIPLDGGRVESLRQGTAFWSYLEQHDIFSTVFSAPANFPVDPHASQALSGMGTPDLLGTYGTFTYFTDAYVPDAESFTGGRVVKLRAQDHVYDAVFSGPPNALRKDQDYSEIPLRIARDPSAQVAKVTLQDHQVILKQGEWSEWLPLSFEMMPLFSGVSGMVRLYMQEVHPYLRLYASPINIDPTNPTLPICTPKGYSKDLSRVIGRFYTLGFPQDTKALSHGVFSAEEFLAQGEIVVAERMRAFQHELSQFHEGFFFFYFGSTDQSSHMLWHNMDPNHPLYEPHQSESVKNGIYHHYRMMDDALAQVMAKMDERSTLMVMSDHGFAPFTRQFNLSTWLVENGFTVLEDYAHMEDGEFYSNVDWDQTRAYAMGLNGVYINVKGREQFGAVPPDQVQAVKDEIIAKMADVRDPETGSLVLTRGYDSQTLYSGPHLALAPDIIVGYRSGYRISDEACLGKFPRQVVQNRTDKWAADHCMDAAVVPGILISNKPVVAENPALWDLGPTILREFGIDTPPTMEGRPILKT